MLCLALPQLAAADPAETPYLGREAGFACRAGGCVTLAGVVISGATAITPTSLATHYEPYLTQEVNLNDLARIADSITARYRQEGFFLSRALIPPQDDSGVARIVVIEGRITEVSIRGAGRVQASPFLRGLAEEPIARLSDLDRRLALANDVPGLAVRAHIEPNPHDPASHRLVVETEHTSTAAFAVVDNRGDENVGPLQAYTRLARNGVLTARDQIAVGVYTTPASPRDFMFAEGTYSYRFGDGAALALTGSISRAGDGHDMNSPDIGSDSQVATLAYEQPLMRRGDRGLWLGGALDAWHAEGDWISGGGYVDDIRTASLSLRGYLNDDGHASSVFVQTVIGLDILGASARSLARRSRADADGAFARVNLTASHYRNLGRYFGVFASIDAQWADTPLLLSQEFAPGGLPYGRAYNAGEIRGDRGVAGLVELRAGYDPNLDAVSFLQGYVFADVGEVWNFGAGADSLASAGVGARVTFDDWLTARMELARPLTRTPYAEDDKDWRQFFSLSAAY